VGVDVVEACFDVKEDCGDPEFRSLEGLDVMSAGQASVKGTETREETALVRVEETSGAGKARQSDRHDLFQDFGYCFKENDNPTGGGRVLGDLPKFIQDNTVCLLERGGVVAKGYKRGQVV